MRPLLPSAAVVVAVLAGAACGSRHGSAQGGDDGGETSEGSTADDGGSFPAEAASGADGPATEGGLVGDGSVATDCAAGTDLVYLVSEERELYSFDPAKNVITLLASVDCASGSYANSMAIDRTATAWINYGDGSLWRANTKTGACSATGFVPNQQGVGLFGMGFAAKAAGGSAEQLFIDDLGSSGQPGNGLGYIDTSTMKLQLFGPLTGAIAGRSAELTGTGDARLFGFFEGSYLGDAGSASVAQIDPSSEGPVVDYPLAAIDTGSDWAFSFWGGDFYLYTADKYDGNAPYTDITRFRPSDGSVTVVDAQIGFRIVGAGVSTCAPTTPAQ